MSLCSVSLYWVSGGQQGSLYNWRWVVEQKLSLSSNFSCHQGATTFSIMSLFVIISINHAQHNRIECQYSEHRGNCRVTYIIGVGLLNKTSFLAQNVGVACQSYLVWSHFNVIRRSDLDRQWKQHCGRWFDSILDYYHWLGEKKWRNRLDLGRT